MSRRISITPPLSKLLRYLNLYYLRQELSRKILSHLYFDVTKNSTISQIRLLNIIKPRTIIILDALRYDMYKSVLDGVELKELKRGFLIPCTTYCSCTLEYIMNVYMRYIDSDDVLLITAQPWFKYVSKRVKLRSKIVEAYKLWDNRLGTVPPNSVNLLVKIELARRTLLKERIRLIIIWYLQPHWPYYRIIKAFRRASESKAIGNKLYALQTLRDDVLYNIVRKMFLRKKLSLAIVKELYRENILWVLMEVRKILSLLPKPIVITSDHGEPFGEYGIFLVHCYGIRVPSPAFSLVPFHVIP